MNNIIKEYNETINNVEHTVKIYQQNKIIYFVNGLIHREDDKPAIILNDNIFYWYKKGKITRNNDLPAYINKKEQVEKWYNNGLLHRENGLPAYINLLEKTFHLFDKEVSEEEAKIHSLKIKINKF